MYLIGNIDFLFVGFVVSTIIVFGFTIYFNNRYSLTNKAFLVFSLITSAWGVVSYLTKIAANPYVYLWLSRLVLFFAVWQAFTIFHFLYIFPAKKIKFPKLYNKALLPLVILTSLVTLTPFVLTRLEVNPEYTDIYKAVLGPGMILFGVLAVGLVVSGVALLLHKISQSKKETREALKDILIGLVSTFTLIILFNFLIVVIFDNRNFLSYGATFFLPFIGFTAYAILRQKLFNLRVVSTMVFIILLAMVTFAEVILSSDKNILVYRSFELIVVLTFGVLLIRSVLNEVDQREKLAMLANKLEIANEKLKSLDKLKTEFLSLASHQLRSPLTAIKGYSSMLLEGSYGVLADTTQREAVERIFQSSTALAKTVEDFLNVSKIEQGGMKYEFDEIDISKLAKEIVNELVVSAEARGLKLTFSTIDNGPYIARVDANKIRQVLLNFIDNGIKYTKEGFVSVRVGRDSDSKKIIFSVEDSGMGMTPEIKSQLFQKFSRGNGARMNTGGSGLGLYLAKEIVRAHKGSVDVSSPGLGKGSTFYVTLPALG